MLKHKKLKVGEVFTASAPYVLIRTLRYCGHESKRRSVHVIEVRRLQSMYYPRDIYNQTGPVVLLGLTNLSTREHNEAYYKLLVGEKIVYCYADTFKQAFRRAK
jgi:hypothetical protein